MRPKKKSTQTAVADAIDGDSFVEEVEQAPAQSQQTRQQPMSPRERVKLAHALTTIIEDDEVAKVLRSKPYGSHVLELFTTAVESRLNELMGGTGEEEAQKASEILSRLEMAETVILRLLQGVQQSVQPKPLQPQPQRATRSIPAYEDEFERPTPRVSGGQGYNPPADEGEFV